MSKERKLKIIHTEASPHWGGQEIRIFEEMKWFREQGHEMILVAPNNGTLYERCNKDGFKVISIYFTKPRVLINIFKMLWIIWQEKPNVVATHSSTDSWAGLIAAKLLRIRKKVRYRHVSTPIKKNFTNSIQYRSLCDLIITTGQCIKTHIIGNFSLSPAKVISVPTAINPPKQLESRKIARKRLCSEIHVSASNFLIGQVSVLRSWKGHKILIDAFSALSKKVKNTRLVIIGDGPIKEEIRLYIEKLSCRDKIHLLGHKNDPYLYLSALDLNVLASTKNEGIPQSLLQSMYVRTPVVGTSIGGIPEIIDDGITGLLIEPNNPTQLVEKLNFIISNEERAFKMSQLAHDLVSLNFSREKLWNTLTHNFY